MERSAKASLQSTQVKIPVDDALNSSKALIMHHRIEDRSGIMLATYIAIGTGGALGAVSRFALGRALPTTAFTHFPLQIFLVNALGCLVMGILLEFMAFYWSPSPTIRSFLTTVFLGGFTTFSAFALEFGLLVDKNLHAHAIFYALSSVMASILCFFVGIRLVRILAI